MGYFIRQSPFDKRKKKGSSKTCSLFDQDEVDTFTQRQGLRPAVQSQGPDPLPHQPDGAASVRRSHLQGCPQRLVEVQVKRGILVPTCPAILHDLHRVREGARKAVEETGGPVRLDRDAPTRHSSRNFSVELATTSK